jgi:hypothetical protein
MYPQALCGLLHFVDPHSSVSVRLLERMHIVSEATAYPPIAHWYATRRFHGRSLTAAGFAYGYGWVQGLAASGQNFQGYFLGEAPTKLLRDMEVSLALFRFSFLQQDGLIKAAELGHVDAIEQLRTHLLQFEPSRGRLMRDYTEDKRWQALLASVTKAASLDREFRSLVQSDVQLVVPADVVQM